MAEYIEYHPLKFWLDPASIAEIVAHIQAYLVNNPINSTTEIETIIHDYLIAHPELIGGVDSVNGETGEVVLTADNINAGETVTIKDVLDSLQDQINNIIISIPSDYQQLIDDVSDLKSALNDDVNGIITGEKVKSYTFQWVDGGINASTGALNSNAYAIRTNPVQFNTDSISIDDRTRNNIWRLYWVSYSDETAISTSKVDSGSFANADFPVTLSVNPNLYYRFMYLDTSSTARPSADGLTMVGNTSEPFQIQYVPDAVRADVDGIKQIVSLSGLTWVAGRINSSGANFNGAGYAYRTNDYYEFENEIVTVQDANANHANYTLVLYGYDKETSAFVAGVVWPYIDVANKKIRVNTAYKYRFMYLDTTSTEMPDYTKLSLDYGYTSNSFSSVNEKLESLSDADPFRVKNAIRKPRITFIDDDGHIQFYRLIYPLMLQKGVPYCVAYMANEYPYYPGNLHMTYAQCQDVVDAGGEILGHGTTDLTTLSIQAAETDVTNTKAILEQYGFDIKGYVYPSGGSNPSIRAMIAKHYAYGMKTNEAQQVYRVNTNCVPSYYINRCNNGGYYDAQTGDYANVDTASLDYMKSVIDECVSQNGWLIFVSHAAYMPEGSRRPGYENVDQVQLLSDTIDYILSLKNGGTDIDIVTASEAFAMFGNAYEAGDYLGYWNESQNYHTVPGCAISKEGKWDFPNSQRITHA